MVECCNTRDAIITVDSMESTPSTHKGDHSQRYYIKSYILQKKPLLTKIGIFIILVLSVTLGLTFGLQSRRNNDIARPTNLYTRNSLPFFNSESTSTSIIDESYDTCNELKDDLESAARFIIDAYVDDSARRKFHDDGNNYMPWIPRGGFGGMDTINTPTVMEEGATEKGGTTATTGGSAEGGGGGGGSGGEDSFGTNNQVDGVEEADLIKSDGMFVYAAYGNQIVIWNATTGSELSRTTLPTDDEDGVSTCDNDSGGGGGGGYYSVSTKKVAGESSSGSSSDSNCYQSYGRDINIKSLLLHEKRLVAIASAPWARSDDNDFILSGRHQTRVFTYDLTSMSTVTPMVTSDDTNELTLLGRTDLLGSYQTARSIHQNAHIVTNSYVNTWYTFSRHLSPWNEKYEGMKENQYRQAAYDVALTYIPQFAESLMKQICNVDDVDDAADDDDNSSIDITKVALMLRELKQDVMEDTPLSFTSEGVLKNYVQIHSFDIQEKFTNDDGTSTSSSSSSSDKPIITSTKAGVFLPTASYSQSIYSSASKLIISGNAYAQGIDFEWKERTILFAFDLKDGKAVAHSVGEVPGSVLNQFSMDHYNYDGNGDDDDDNGQDYIRVATTSWARFGLVDGSWTQTLESTNQVSILKLPPDTTTNSKMELVGQVTGMGVGERIYAARFIKEKGYVVTFRQVDPFYTLNLADPTNPEVVGELKIPGFSNYLHPVTDDLILALGQDANENTGIVEGLQIAMFNVSDFSDPKQIHKYVEKGYSSSDAQYEHKAFRYLPKSKLLILPLSIYTDYRESFDGFVVYDVDENKDSFSRSFQISHKDKDNDKSICWDNSYLPSRSLVFDGKVTTTKQHTVLSHDLTTFEKQWSLNLDSNRTEDRDNCWYW